jgi:dolichol-phosphate mannosyltransferase
MFKIAFCVLRIDEFRLGVVGVSVCIVVPTYNEAENIADAILEIGKALAGVSHAVIVVDDNSPDGTADIARQFGAHVVVRPRRLGVGTAVLDGVREARKLGCRFVGVTDADLQHDVSKLRVMHELLSRGVADLVVGSRYLPGGGVDGGWGFARRVISRGAEFYTHLLMPKTRELTDSHGNFFMVRLDVVDLNGIKLRGRPHEVLPIIIQHLKPGARIVEIPYVFRQRRKGRSKLGVKAIIDYAVSILLASPLLPILLAGVTGVFVNLGVLSLLLFLHLPMIASSAVAIEASIINNYLVADYFLRRNRVTTRLNGLLRYHGSVVLGVAVQYATANALYYLAHVYPLIAQFAGVLLGFFANYYLATTMIWK